MIMFIICFFCRTCNSYIVKRLGLVRDKYGGSENTFKIFGFMMHRLERMKNPYLHGIIFDENKYIICKSLIGLIFGVSIGIAFYEFILTGLSLDNSIVYMLGKYSTLLIAIGCMASAHIRCVTMLCVPTFFGSAGRNIVRAVIISTVISGPISNIIINIEEIMRMVSCSNTMAYNMSQARYNLLVKPFKIAFLSTKIESEELRDTLGSVKNVVEPLSQEIEGEDDIKFIREENDYMDMELNDTKRSEEISNKYANMMPFLKASSGKNATDDRNKRTLEMKNDEKNKSTLANEYQQKYYKKLEIRCENVKTSMTNACQKTFYNFYDRCMATLHWSINWAICWAVKLDFICDVVRMFSYGNYDCDPSTVVSDNVGNQYVSVLNTGPNLKAKVAEERTQYKIKNPPNFVSLHSVITITKEFYHEIKNVHNWAQFVIKVLKTILTFLFIWVIKSSSTYQERYIHETDFDNNYLTADFRVIDAWRKKEGKTTVLPLMKVEKIKLADPYSPFLGPAEWEAWVKEFYILLFLFIFCTIVVVADFLLAAALTWMANNLEFSYKEAGEHSFRMEVLGVGFIASVVRSLIKPLNFSKAMKEEVSNKFCLPNSKYLPLSSYFHIYGSCTALYFMAYGEGYIKRIRRAICAFYYRYQEIRRIEILYKKTLDYRQELVKRHIKELAEKVGEAGAESDLRLLFMFYQWFPDCRLIRYFSCARPSCAMCLDIEERNPTKAQVYIRCYECKIFFCPECWYNFSKSCVVCAALVRKDKELMENLEQAKAKQGVAQKPTPPKETAPKTKGTKYPPKTK